MADHAGVITALVVLMSVLAVGAASAAVVVMMLRRSVEVATRHRVGVPVRWLVVPSRPGMLHRRLRNAVSILRRAVPAPRAGKDTTNLQDLADEVEVLAVAVDRELLDTACLPLGPRQAALGRAATSVARVEDLARRVAHIAVEGDPSHLVGERWERRADEVEARLSALRAAQAEVDELEQQLGLG